ncbi:MAG: hypothetical protein ACE367_27590 [Acidimicrobiales bacterium]
MRQVPYADAIARMEDRPVRLSSDEDPAAEVPPDDPATAVAQVWERYLRSRYELESSSPSDDAIDVEAYSIEEARVELLSIYRGVIFDGYVDWRTLTSDSIEVRLLGPSSAQIESCVVETIEPYWEDGALVEPEPFRLTAWARLVRVTESKWSVAEVDFEGRRC